jgi:hypothetical protein
VASRRDHHGRVDDVACVRLAAKLAGETGFKQREWFHPRASGLYDTSYPGLAWPAPPYLADNAGRYDNRLPGLVCLLKQGQHQSVLMFDSDERACVED